MFDFGMRQPSSFGIPRCRVQPCPAEDVIVRDQTLRREYSVGGREAHGIALFKRKWPCRHVDCWDTLKNPYDHDGLAVAAKGVQMKLARLDRINATDAGLLQAVRPKALPRTSRVPLCRSWSTIFSNSIRTPGA